MVFDWQFDEALGLHSDGRGLRAPAEHALGAFKQLFEPEHRKTRPRGQSSRILDDGSDSVALRVPADQDRLTKVVQVYLPWLFISSSDRYLA